MPTFQPGNLEGRSRLDHIEEYLQSPKCDSLIRQQIRTSARGILDESFNVGLGAASSVIGASIANGACVGLRAGDVVTNIVTFIATAQAPSVFQGGLYDKTGTHLGHTASLGASIVGSTFWVAPLTSPVTITRDDAYYPMLLSYGAATLPSIHRTSIVGGIGNAIGNGIFNSVLSSGAVTDLTANLTLVAASNMLYYAVS